MITGKSNFTYERSKFSISLLNDLLSLVVFELSHGDLTIVFRDFLKPQVGLHVFDLPFSSVFGNSSSLSLERFYDEKSFSSSIYTSTTVNMCTF